MNADQPDPGAPSPLPERLRVVVVGNGILRDEPAIETLVRAGFAPEWRRVSEEEAFAQALAAAPDVVLAEYSAASFAAARALECLKAHGHDVPLIVVSGPVDPDVTVDLMQRGAADFVLSNRLERLGPAVRRALDGGRRRAPRTEEAVGRAAEVQYRDLVARVLVGLCRITATGEFLQANPAFLDIVRYPSLDALRSVTAFSLYPDPRDRARYTSLLERDGAVTDFEAQMRRGDGTLIWARASARPALDPIRQIVCYEGLVVDVTARRQAEEETHRRAMHVETFAEVGKRLREADRVEQIYALLVETAMSLLMAQHGSLNLTDADQQRLTRVYTTGVMQEAGGVTYPVAGSFSERVITTGAPYVTEDIAREARLPWLPPAYYEALGPVVIVPVRSEHDIVGTLVLSRLRGAEAHPFSDSEVWLLNAIAEIGGTAIRRAQLRENLEQAYIQMVLALARTVDARDSYTGTHSEHLAVWAEAVGRELGCDDEELRVLRWGALLHDIGKIGVPDEILRKPGALTDEEWTVMRKHPAIGEEILRPVEHMGRVAALVRHHQERWDGTGYPDGLRGDAIPLGARIVAVADAYGAMMDDRAYRKGRPKEDALRDLRRAAGTQFDPQVVDVFCRLMEQDTALSDALPARLEESGAVRPAVQAIARSLTQARQAGRVMPVMADVAKRLLRPLDLPTVLDEILSQMQEVFAYPVCAICLLDEPTQELRVATQRGYNPAVTKTARMRVGEDGIIGWVARHGHSYYAADVAFDQLYVAWGPGIGSEVAYPLIADGRVLGVLDVASPAVDAFPRDVRDVLETFATLAALAILRAQHDDDLKRLALTDGLTGLANHRALWDALEREVARARRDGHLLSVLMVEIDRFKLANDQFGHLQGDDILRAVADVLKRHTRAGDLAARFGGDEFVLLLPGAPKDDAAGIAERVRRYIEEIPREFTSLTVSIGVATMPDDGDTPRALIEAADQAMYQAKYIGGNRVNVA